MSSTPTLTLRQINRATLARQMLLARERLDPLKAIERLVALQAQLARPPFIGLWSRLEGFEREALTRLFETRKVVRATFNRATIHVVTAKDYLSLRPAVQPGLDYAARSILRERLDALDVGALLKQARALFSRRPLTFEELRDAFLEKDPKADERAMGYCVRLKLPLVQVPEKGAAWAFPAQASFALADEWLGKTVPTTAAPPDALILRYLAAYGPASAADIVAWAGISRESVREALARLQPSLVTFRDEAKRELFDLPEAPRPPADVPAPVRLIPEYDNLLNTRADERFVAKAHRPRVFLSALRLAATVLVDGFVAGTWKLTATKRTATIAIDPFAPFPARVRKEVAAEAEALARFAEPEARNVEVRMPSA
ncbi:MAG TPA: winged helix DNA-binding domain-containing protein [Vicinamibacterales bacterium]